MCSMATSGSAVSNILAIAAGIAKILEAWSRSRAYHVKNGYEVCNIRNEGRWQSESKKKIRRTEEQLMLSPETFEVIQQRALFEIPTTKQIDSVFFEYQRTLAVLSQRGCANHRYVSRNRGFLCFYQSHPLLFSSRLIIYVGSKIY
jgi:hypothetical protein